MRDRGGRRIAIVVVERRDLDAFDRVAIEAAYVDVDALRMRTRHIERLDPADATEAVSGRTGIKSILSQDFGAREQAKARRGHDQMQKTCHAADRAIAVERFDARRRVDLETHRSA